MPRTLPRLTVTHAAALAAAVAIAAASSGIAGRATHGMRTTGDEPHYLLTAVSIAEDGDLDVADEIAGDRYRPFHERGLAPQSVERADGSMVAPHDPLLPALLALPMAWGGFLAAKATLALVAGALAALLVWTMVRRFDVPVVAALATTAVFTAAAPLAVYGHQVYPELPAALAVTAAVAALTGRLERRGLLVLGSAVVALPWLGVKYAPVAAVLAAIGLVRLWRSGERARAGGFGVALVLAGVAYAAAHLAWYGGMTAYAAGDFFQEHGGQLSVVGTGPDLLGRSRRLVGLLVGGGFGLAAWQPAWLLAVPALAALSAERPRGWSSLVVPAAIGWVTATFVAVTMHGWWFPGRHTVAVLPLLVIAVGWWAGRSGPRIVVVAITGALGAATYAWLAVEAARGEVTWVVDFAATTDPWYRLWRTVLPDYLRPGPRMWVLHATWTVALIALGWWARRSGGGVGGRLGRPLGAAAGPGVGAGAGAGARTGARPGPGGLAAAVELADRRAVVRAAGGQGQGEDEDGGGGHAPQDR